MWAGSSDRDRQKMPYVFPYEDHFVFITAAVIVGLLFLRVRLVRHRKAQLDTEAKRKKQESHERSNRGESALR